MNKDVLRQYYDMRNEEKELKSRIQSLNDQILNLELKLTMVSDTVTAGKKGKKPLRTITIKGIDQRPMGLIERKKQSMADLKKQLEALDADLIEKMAECEVFVSEIKDSHIRQIVRYRDIDGLSWIKVAQKMHTTEDSVRMAYNRFMDKN